MADFELTQGDTLPALTVRMLDSTGAVYQPAAGATCAFRAVRRTDGHVITGAAVITTDTLTWTPVSGDTDQPGEYDVQFTVVLIGGQRVSFPTCSGATSSHGFLMEVCAVP